MIDPIIDARGGYNADSIIRVGVHNNLELLIAEVSSSFSKVDKSKHATDHYKGMFGLLSMCKAIADEYRHASLRSFKKQKVFFIQAYNQHVYFWSLFCVDENLFCLLREKKAKIPHLFDDRCAEVLNFMYFVNEVKVEMKKTLLNLDELEKEHKDNMKKRRYVDNSEYITLDKIIKPSIVKISELKGYKGMAQAEPLSSQESVWFFCLIYLINKVIVVIALW